jgi:hypothetical protein
VAAGVVVALLVVTALVFSGWYREHYHRFAWWEPPAKIEWCDGRSYFPTTFTGGPRDKVVPSYSGPLVKVLSVPPLGRAVYAEDPHVVHDGGACTMALFYVSSGNGWVYYGLSGGP